MIEAVTIDFWNTIVDSSNGEARRRYRNEALRSALARLGRSATDEELECAYAKNSARFETVWREEQRTLTTSESLDIIWASLHVEPTPRLHSETVNAFQESVMAGLPCLLDGAADTLHSLAASYPLALISDTAFSPGAMLRRVLEHHGLSGLFRAMIFSDEIGASKPHPRTFGTALTILGVSASQAVHIGDIDRTDIRGARLMGMRSIRFIGDEHRSYQEGPGDAAQADAEARHWSEIPEIISRLDQHELT